MHRLNTNITPFHKRDMSGHGFYMGVGGSWNQPPKDTVSQLYIKHRLVILKARFLFLIAALSSIISSSVKETEAQSSKIIC